LKSRKDVIEQAKAMGLKLNEEGNAWVPIHPPHIHSELYGTQMASIHGQIPENNKEMVVNLRLEEYKLSLKILIYSISVLFLCFFAIMATPTIARMTCSGIWALFAFLLNNQ
jgi:hypothetical protein